ncbi:uncharacterized protein LOC110863504 [Folsomia candida]|uniref:uncharacterized protein LOC110863504 n=1 Tax=Folsomia candida TaxID=158441 RepID=UPI000B90423C|nr:uncharacterized protein LOC110863504 [Folsomia candida]
MNNSGVIFFMTLVIVTFYYLHLLNVKNNRVSSQSSATRYPPQEVVEAKPVAENWEVSKNGYWVGQGAVKGHNFDAPLAEGMLKFLQSEGCKTILKLGSGTGAYARFIKKHDIHVSCYDGNPSTQENTEGTCGVLDFSKALDLSPAEWVISLEVGEHIPAEFESVFIQNIKQHAKNGVILSWSVEGQGGVGHVNNRNNDYIRSLFHQSGYASDYRAEVTLRKVATLPWFKNTLMVFKKKNLACNTP